MATRVTFALDGVDTLQGVLFAPDVFIVALLGKLVALGKSNSHRSVHRPLLNRHGR
jgi:hypothetical protein